MQKYAGGLRKRTRFGIYIVCGLVSFVFLNMELSKINVFAVETNATFRVKTCIKVSKDGGTTYQTIDKALGSNGVTRYWPIYTPGKTTEDTYITQLRTLKT